MFANRFGCLNLSTSKQMIFFPYLLTNQLIYQPELSPGMAIVPKRDAGNTNKGVLTTVAWNDSHATMVVRRPFFGP